MSCTDAGIQLLTQIDSKFSMLSGLRNSALDKKYTADSSIKGIGKEANSALSTGDLNSVTSEVNSTANAFEDTMGTTSLTDSLLDCATGSGCTDVLMDKVGDYGEDAWSATQDALSKIPLPNGPDISGIPIPSTGLGSSKLQTAVLDAVNSLNQYSKYLDTANISGLVGEMDNLLNCTQGYPELDMDGIQSYMDGMNEIELDLGLEDGGTFDYNKYLEAGIDDLTLNVEDGEQYMKDLQTSIKTSAQSTYDSVQANGESVKKAAEDYTQTVEAEQAEAEELPVQWV